MNEELTRVNAQLGDKGQEVTATNDDLGSLLMSTDIATVLIDTDLRIKRFTAAATSLLNLLPADVGRSLTHLATNLVDVDLAGDARTVLGTAAPIEKEVAARDGSQYFMRVLPYRTEGKVQGAVLTLIDVTALKRTERELRSARDELGQLNQTLEERVAQRTKWLTLMHQVTRVISEASSWDDALHLVLRHLCESEKWQVGYVYLPDPDAAAEIRPAISCFEDERFRPFHLAAKDRRYSRGQSLPGRVHAEGIPVWVNSQEELLALLPMRADAVRQVGLRSAVALPIVIGREIIAVLELFSDRPHERSEELANLMTDVSTQIGRVLERERLTTQMAELVWREQQELLHTLHDSLGQTLTGLGMLSSALVRRLTGADADAGETAQQIAQQAQRALRQVRELANGLFPVEVDAEGLMPALRQLASTTESLHKVRVVVEGNGAPAVHEPRVATQLYRIVQEAVTNAVKHAQPRTIRIQVSDEPGLTTIVVADDGVGLTNSVPKTDGLGLRIMRYRATSIGAHLTIDSGPGGGTIVTCTLREAPRMGASEPWSEGSSAGSSPGEKR